MSLMRRKDREITDHTVIGQMIENCDVCRICMNDTPVPYAVPLNFGYEWKDGVLTMFFHCAAEGRKLELLRRDPRVFFQMDGCHRLVLSGDAAACTMAFDSVMGTGEVRFLEGEEARKGLVRILRRYGSDAPLTPEHPMLKHTVVFSVTSRTVTAKRLEK